MRWFERDGRRVPAIAPLLVAAVAASLLVAPTGYSAVPTGAVATAVATSARAQTVGPARARTVPAAVAISGAALSAVGQLLAGEESCSAAVVGSSSGRVAVTAAHCVYVPAATERMPDVADGRDPGWADEVVFVPARSGDDAPHEVWAVGRMWVDRTWQANASPEVDVAFLELRDMPEGTAQQVLGALGMQFDDAGTGRQADGEGVAGPTVDVMGYPTAAPFDGTRLRSCEQVPTDRGWAGLLEARCGLTPGASGGPWIVSDRDWWSVVAVTSYLSWDRPGMLGGVRFGAVAERLWRAADEAAGQQ